jgi:hypothetical protein
MSGMSTDIIGREYQSGEEDVNTMAADDAMFVWLAADVKLKTRCRGAQDSE